MIYSFVGHLQKCYLGIRSDSFTAFLRIMNELIILGLLLVLTSSVFIKLGKKHNLDFQNIENE